MGRFLVPRRSQVVRWRGTLEDLLPPDHLARFVWQVLGALDFSAVEAGYRAAQGGRGRSPYHPQLVAALWIYGMTQGLETAAAIAQACRLRDDFRWLAGGLCPSDQTLLNFLSVVPDGLGAIWTQVLEALHRAGHIDLSAVVEDGTKLRANASRRSFHTVPEIKDILDALERQLATTLHALGEPPRSRADQRQVRALQGRIDRATQAAAELHQRRERRRPDPPGPRGDAAGEPVAASAAPAPASPPLKFERSAFHHDAERDVLVCPAGHRLGFVGIYREPPRDSYRLYRAAAADCGPCRVKAQCTAASRRCVKIPTATGARPASPPSCPSDAPPDSRAHGSAPDPPAGPRRPAASGPQASLTEPEAVLMLATADKQWQPSYNADLTVTRHQFIINQFLTKDTTDFASFGRALPAVLATVGRPEAWIGDGHYGTQENVLLAHRAEVVLYAPPAGAGPDAAPAPAPRSAEGVAAEEAAPVEAPGGPPDAAGGDDRPRPATAGFCREDFRHDPERDLLICPTGEPLRLIGVYAEPQRAAYHIYGRRDCGACAVKPQCTTGRGRRVKLRVPLTGRSPTSQPARELPAPRASAGARPPPSGPGEVAELVHALAVRMRQIGDRIKAFRSATIEPVNAQLKQHGLGRFHVHGLSRCAIVLTLACIAHNLMKWKAREAAHALSVPA